MSKTVEHMKECEVHIHDVEKENLDLHQKMNVDKKTLTSLRQVCIRPLLSLVKPQYCYGENYADEDDSNVLGFSFAYLSDSRLNFHPHIILFLSLHCALYNTIFLLLLHFMIRTPTMRYGFFSIA